MINDNEQQILKAANIIHNGGVVAFPTETVYGLGANGLDEKAAAQVFEIKRRPFFDPLILHVGGKEWIDELVTNIPAQAHKLVEMFWPGALTVVLPKKRIVPDVVTSGLPGVAVRMPSNDIAHRLIKLVGVPIAAPSANLFGSVSPTTAEHVREQLGASVELVIDGGRCTVGVESTIVSFMTGAPLLLRSGGVTIEEIEDVIGKVIIPKHDEFANQSPGRSNSHYATSVPLFLVDDIGSIDKSVSVGLLTTTPVDPKTLPQNIIKTECLSTTGDLREAACNLFAAMRRLDASDIDMIAALPVPNAGLGMAINDRLYRASKKGGPTTSFIHKNKASIT